MLHNKQNLKKIYDFCKEKLENIHYKYGEKNKFDHCKRVAAKIYSFFYDFEGLNVIALLHDILECTNVKEKDLFSLGLNEKQINIIKELKIKNNSNTFKLGKCKHMAVKLNILSDEALLIELASRLDNIKSLLELRTIKQYKKENNKKDIENKISFYLSQTFYLIEMIEDKIIEKEEEDNPLRNKINMGICNLYNEINIILLDNKW